MNISLTIAFLFVIFYFVAFYSVQVENTVIAIREIWFGDCGSSCHPYTRQAVQYSYPHADWFERRQSTTNSENRDGQYSTGKGCSCKDCPCNIFNNIIRTILPNMRIPSTMFNDQYCAVTNFLTSFMSHLRSIFGLPNTNAAPTPSRDRLELVATFVHPNRFDSCENITMSEIKLKHSLVGGVSIDEALDVEEGKELGAKASLLNIKEMASASLRSNCTGPSINEPVTPPKPPPRDRPPPRL